MSNDERSNWIEQQESSSDNRVVAIPASELRQLLRDAMAFADAEWRKRAREGAEVLRHMGKYEKAEALFAFADRLTVDQTRQEDGAGLEARKPQHDSDAPAPTPPPREQGDE